MELGNILLGHSRGEFPIPDRTLYRELIQPLFDAMRTDGYGTHFSNDVFEMHPYCWCGSDECPQCAKGTQSNLLFKPTGFRLNWYKYAMRDAYTSMEVTPEMFGSLSQTCIESLPVDTSPQPVPPTPEQLAEHFDRTRRKMELNSTSGAYYRPSKPS